MFSIEYDVVDINYYIIPHKYNFKNQNENFLFKSVLNLANYSGKKSTAFKLLSNYFKFFFFNFFVNYLDSNIKKYLFINQFQSQISSNIYYLNWFNIFASYIHLLTPIFYISVNKVDKKYRKKLKTNYKYKIYYLHPTQRILKAFKIISTNFKSVNGKKLQDKVFYFLNELILNYKNSSNFLLKLKIYKKILNKKN